MKKQVNGILRKDGVSGTGVRPCPGQCDTPPTDPRPLPSTELATVGRGKGIVASQHLVIAEKRSECLSGVPYARAVSGNFEIEHVAISVGTFLGFYWDSVQRTGITLNILIC